MGRQWASGLSLLFPARRAFSRSAAHGCSGNPSFILAATFANVVSGGPAVNEGAGPGSVPPPAGPRRPSPRIQLPEKSGLSWAVRGGGAVSCGLPSGVFGTPRAGYGGHWARSGATSTEARAMVASCKPGVCTRCSLPHPPHHALYSLPLIADNLIHSMADDDAPPRIL